MRQRPVQTTVNSHHSRTCRVFMAQTLARRRGWVVIDKPAGRIAGTNGPPKSNRNQLLPRTIHRLPAERRPEVGLAVSSGTKSTANRRFNRSGSSSPCGYYTPRATCITPATQHNQRCITAVQAPALLCSDGCCVPARPSDMPVPRQRWRSGEREAVCRAWPARGTARNHRPGLSARPSRTRA